MHRMDFKSSLSKGLKIVMRARGAKKESSKKYETKIGTDSDGDIC